MSVIIFNFFNFVIIKIEIFVRSSLGFKTPRVTGSQKRDRHERKRPIRVNRVQGTEFTSGGYSGSNYCWRTDLKSLHVVDGYTVKLN